VKGIFMCGIAGIIDFKDQEDRAPALRRMLRAMQHRGPDATGVYQSRQASLAHARLSIIDLSGGHQPMSNEDGTIWIVFNGEIFNYPELRDELIERGHRFATRSDTEVIVHLYEEHGSRLFNLAQRSVRHRHLGCSANKRCCWAATGWASGRSSTIWMNGRLHFASEIKALFTDAADSAAARSADLVGCLHLLDPCGPADGLSRASISCPPAHFAVFDSRRPAM
jgi:asparagine synthase (glutamine-hydrolysing)